jgi:D-3-phosphoglycerate dehydrogenase
MNIVILDDYQDQVRQLAAFPLLAGHAVRVYTNTVRGLGQLALRLKDADALVLIRERTPITRALLAKLPRLQLISQTGKVAGHIDVDACTAHGVAIAEGVGSPVAPAELTWALVMAAQRKLVPYATHLKEGRWQMASANPALNTLGVVNRGRVLGIWGFGKIGRLVAGYGRAFGMDVLVWGSEASRAAAVELGYRAAPTHADFFAAADVLTLHLRLNEYTRACVRAADLAGMKADALFVNTSRAELVEDGALEAALRAGRPGRAALDVYPSEPLAADAALVRLPTVLATPHLGYVERDRYELYFRAAFENIVAFAGGAPANVLNPQALAVRAQARSQVADTDHD